MSEPIRTLPEAKSAAIELLNNPNVAEFIVVTLDKESHKAEYHQHASLGFAMHAINRLRESVIQDLAAITKESLDV